MPSRLDESVSTVVAEGESTGTIGSEVSLGDFGLAGTSSWKIRALALAYASSRSLMDMAFRSGSDGPSGVADPLEGLPGFLFKTFIILTGCSSSSSARSEIRNGGLEKYNSCISQMTGVGGGGLFFSWYAFVFLSFR